MKKNKILFVVFSFPLLLVGCGNGPAPQHFETDLKIVYKENGSLREKELADDLVKALKQNGVNYELVNDSATYNEAINIGKNASSTWSKTTPQDKYGVYKDNKKILVDGGSTSSLIDGTKYIFDLILEAKKSNKSIFSMLSGDVLNSYHDYGLKIMSYNLLTSDKKSSSGEMIYLKDRLPRIAKVVLTYLPDSFGAQEFNHKHVEGENNLMTYLGDTYRRVGGTRYHNNPQEEGTSVFYNYHTTELIDYGTLWPTENLYVPTEKSEHSQYMRVFTWAVLKKISSGKQYLHISTHLDLAPDARREQVRYIESFASRFYDKMPVFITADYNDDYYNTNPSDYCYGVAVKYLLEEKHYVNSAFNAVDKMTGNTFPSKSFDNEQAVMIDYCLHYGEGIFDNVYKIQKDKVVGIGQSLAGDTSDHMPTYYQYDVYNPLSKSYVDYNFDTYPYSGTVSSELNNAFTSEYPLQIYQPAAFASYTGGSWLNNDTHGSKYGVVKNLSNNDGSHLEYNFKLNKSAPGDVDVWLCNARPESAFDLANVKVSVNGVQVGLNGLTLPSSPGNYYNEQHLILKNVNLKEDNNVIKFENIGQGIPNMVSAKVYTKATPMKKGGVNGMQSTIEMRNGKPYYVTKGVVYGGNFDPREIYVDLRQGDTNFVSNKYQVTIDPVTHEFVSYVDVSSFEKGTYYPHLVLAGEIYDGGNGDILYPRDDWAEHEDEQIPGSSTATYQSKTFKVIQKSRMPALNIS